MIGTLDPNKKKVMVIGAGISGLIISYRLKQLGYSVQIYEKNNRPGGLIQTIFTPYGPAEAAAHSLMINPILQNYFQELGVELQSVNSDSRARYILRNKMLRRFPLSFIEAVRAILQFIKTKKVTFNFNQTTLKEWCLTRLGSPAHEYLLSPFVAGVFACQPSELNAYLTFPKLFGNTSKNPAKKKTKSIMMTPVDSMQSVVDAYAKALRPELNLNSPITASQIQTAAQDTNIIYSVPTESLAVLIEKLDSHSAQLLLEQTHSPLITVTAFFNSTDFKNNPPKGVGVLIPQSENLKTLGVLFNSSAFENRVAHPDHVSLTFMFGGTIHPNALKLTDEEINQIIAQEAHLLFGATTSPLFCQISRWNKAIPLYSNHLLKIHESLKNGLCSQPGTLVFSNYSGQVSIRGMIESSLDLLTPFG